jgi:hypothetical protein
MPYILNVERTVNGKPRTLRWAGWPDDSRQDMEQTIADFRAGVAPMEGTLTLIAGPPEAVAWFKRWRWADIKNIWIED